jgi:preprotein translocase subunit SecE
MSTASNNLTPITRPATSDNRRYAVFSQVAIAVATWWVVGQLLIFVWQLGGFHRWEPFGIHIANFISLAVVGGTFIYTLRNQVAQDFANEVIIELRKVTWPTFKETRQATVVVCICVIVIALILGGFDFIWAKLIKFLLTAGTPV